MGKIFISYSRQDSLIVKPVVNRLEAQGYAIWFDQTAVTGGSKWLNEIRQGIQDSAIFLIFWSKQSSNPFSFVRQELDEALKQPDLVIIPIWMDHTALHQDIQGNQAVFLRNNSQQEIKTIIAHVAEYDDKLDKRTINPLQHDLALGLMSKARPITPDIVSVPVATSGHTLAYLVGYKNLSLADMMAKPRPTVQLCLQVLGRDDDSVVLDVEKLFTYQQELHTQDPSLYPEPEPLFALYVTTRPVAGLLSLDNTRPGMWLDYVNTVYTAAEQIFTRGGVIFQVFGAIPNVLGIAVGRPFYNYWSLQLYNRLRDEERADPRETYRLVLDTRDQ